MSTLKTIKIAAIKGPVTLLRALGYPRRRQGAERRFLVVSTTGVGDTLMGVPAIRALRETFKDSYIGVLTNKSGAELLAGNPDIDKIFVFRRGLAGLRAMPVLLGQLRAPGFDTAIVLHVSDRIVWPLTFLSGAPEIIGTDMETKGMDFIMTRRLRHREIHGIDMRLEVVAETGASTRDKSIKIHLNEADRAGARRFLEGLGIDEKSPIAGLHPGAKDMFKRWPSENFARTGRLLAEKHGFRILITGNATEKALAEGIASSIEGAVSCAGRLTLRETAALYEKLSLLITNDTGPMHMAFAVNTPTVALFCPTNPQLCGPYGVPDAHAIQKPVTCSPCLWKKCYNPRCMEQITVEEVLEAAATLLGQERK